MKLKLLQDRKEFNQLLQVARDEQCESYLEIGSWSGGSLWEIANSLPMGSRVVAIDLPDPRARASLQACADKIGKAGYDMHLFLGDSTDPAIVLQVETLGPFDLCFIDGDHREPFVLKDWENYGRLSRIVAFHDIGWPENHARQVRRVWDRLKIEHANREIISQPDRYGIGVLWRC